MAECLAQYLLRRYTDVSLTLPPDWDDIRGFLWAGMRSHVRYTYRGIGWVMRGRYEKRLNLRMFERKAWERETVHQGDGWSHWQVSYHNSTVDILEDWNGRYYWKANAGGSWHAEIIDSVLPIDEGRIFDMVGCNSPHRALFKRQFGGHLRPYYFVTTGDPKLIDEFWPPQETQVA